MLRKIFAILLFIVSTVLARADYCDAFKPMLNNSIKKWGIPALSMAIKFPNGKIIHCQSGAGNLRTHNPVTKETLFQVGSVTKTFVSALVLLQVQEGKLSLNETISKTVKRYGDWLPKAAQKRWQAVTIKQLLNMTSGIYSYTEDKAFNQTWRKHPQKKWKPEEIISIALKHSDYFNPGAGWHYSDTNYYLLGLLLEKMTHQKLSDLIQDQLLSPLKLKSIYYLPHRYGSNLLKQLARGYGADYVDRTEVNMSQAGPAGAMIANPTSLLKWLSALFSGKVLDDSSLKTMLTAYSKQNGKLTHSLKSPAYGLGLFRVYYPSRGGINWVYLGGTWGYLTWYDWLPAQKLLFVISVNVGMDFKDQKNQSVGYALIHQIAPKFYKEVKKSITPS